MTPFEMGENSKLKFNPLVWRILAWFKFFLSYKSKNCETELVDLGLAFKQKDRPTNHYLQIYGLWL